jgi:putative membrane protein
MVALWLPPVHVHLDVLALMAALEGGYLLAIRRLGPRLTGAGEPVATRGQVVSYSLGVLTLLVAAEWPIHDLAEGYLFSVHMVQHTLISLVAPPLLLLGMPAWLLRWLLSPRWVHAAAAQLTRPLIALINFNLVIALTHWAPVVDFILNHHGVHLAAHVVLFVTATSMWWPVISPLPEMPTLSYPMRMVYLFLQSLLPTIPASFLTFGTSPLYVFYAAAPRVWGISALTDQLIAGLIMKLVGGAILWTAIGIIFFKWWRLEQRTGWDELQWSSAEREIRSGLHRP